MINLSKTRLLPWMASASLLAAGSLTARADFSTLLLSNAPLAYYPFTEAASSAPLHQFTNAGSFGSVLNAHANASVSNGAPGIVGNAGLFVNAVGTGHCETKADAAYSVGMNGTNFTIEFWTQPGANLFNGEFDATGACPVSDFSPNGISGDNGLGGNRSGWLFYMAPATGIWNFRLGLTSGYAANLHAGGPPAAAGVWQHIAATYDGTTVNVYVNGALAATQVSSAATTGWLPNTNSFLRIGATPLVGDSFWETDDGNYYLPIDGGPTTCGNRGWDGLIDEVALYTNVLSASTIAAHYNAATTNPAGYDAIILASHPVGYWNMDDAAVTVPTTFPTSTNAGTLGSVVNGVADYGILNGQPGPGYTGIPASHKAIFADYLTGTFAINDDPGLHFTGNCTLAAWVKPLADNFDGDIIEHGGDGTGVETFLRVTRGYGYGDGNYYEVGSTEGENNDGYYDSVLFPIPIGDIGNWVFLAGTFDGTNWNLYRNGVLAGQIAAYSDPSDGDMDTGAIDCTNQWTLGSRSYPGIYDINGFLGSIAEPAIFDTALTADQIAALYAAAAQPPVITTPPVNPGTVFAGSTVSFSASADGSPTLGYLWKNNGVSTGDTTTSYVISNIAVGSYTVAFIATNAYGSNSSSVSFTAVAAPPTITSPIAAVSRFATFPFSFSVGAGGSAPLTYYWKLSNTVVQVGSSPTYSNTASLANAGTYTVIVSNTAGTASSSATLSVTAVPGGYAGTIITNGPMAYYRLDELSGTVAHDKIGGHDGNYYNATLGQAGYSILDSDTAVTFGGVNSYVGDISGTQINFTGHTNFTLEAWVNGPAGLPDQSSIIAKGIGANGTTETEQFALDVVAGSYRFFTSRGATLYQAVATDGPDGTWQHVVGVYDDLNVLGGGSNLYIFVNGVQEGSGSVNPVGLNGTTSAVSIGSKRTGNDPNYDGTFDGTVDEVAIYNHALTSSQVYADFAAAYGTNLAPFIQVQPASVTNYAGLPVTLRVVAAGSEAPMPLSFQWSKGGFPISGATLPYYTVSSASSSDAGSYTVFISNAVGSTNSSPATITVLNAPTNNVSIPGLVVHLSFDGNLTDLTGRSNNGTGKYSYIPGTNFSTTYGVTNTVPVGANSGVNPSLYYGTPGKVGSSYLHYETDGVQISGNANTGTAIGTNDYYVSLGVKPDLAFGTNISATFSYWVRLPFAYEGGDLPFFSSASNSTFGTGFTFAPSYAYGTASPNPTTPVFNTFGESFDTLGYYGDQNTGAINDGNWHNLVTVLDRAAGKITTYLDGAVTREYLQPNGPGSLSALGSFDSGLPANIGQGANGLYGESMASDIDDLGVWKRALTPLEVASIYSAANNGYSFTGGSYSITITPLSSTATQLTWSVGTLQSSTNAAGPYISITNATSPYVISPTNSMFFRTKL